MTDTAPVVRSKLRLWAAASTLTASVSVASKSPVKRRVRVAVVSPLLTLETPEISTSGISVTSSKLDAVTPLANRDAATLRSTVMVAPCRLPSVSVAGVVDWMLAVKKKNRTVRLARSKFARFASASCAWTDTT